mmetsp:Transcript_1006/g.1861  ORF Transcript_1006/g.1861 Transcript_1006/m.1861 type:complete len:115 (-) Transcript_1006:320-664(-)
MTKTQRGKRSRHDEEECMMEPASHHIDVPELGHGEDWAGEQQKERAQDSGSPFFPSSPASARRGSKNKRATRKQKLLGGEEVADAMDHMQDASTDRRAGWRANKAKGAEEKQKV